IAYLKKRTVTRWQLPGVTYLDTLKFFFRLLQALVGTAIDQDVLSGNERSSFRGQPHDGVGHLLRFSDPFQCRIGRPRIEDLSFSLSRRGGPRLRQLLQSVRRSKARAHVVHQDTVLAKLVRQTLDEPYDRRTNSIRQNKIRYRLFRRDGSDCHNSAPVLLLHVRNHLPREVDRAEEVCFHRLVPVLRRSGQKTLGRRPSRIRDTDVHRTKPLRHRIHELVNRVSIGYVEGIRIDIGPMLSFDLLARHSQRLSVSGTHCDSTSLGSKGLGRSSPDSLA